MRQLIVTGLGHESPTFFLTNDQPQPQTAREVIQTYASRNHVENHLGEQITFFHLDCLCSDVRLNVDFDLTLTVLADLLYRNLAERLKGFARAGPARLFRKFVDTSGFIEIRANRGHRPPEQTSPQPAVERGWADEADATRAVAEGSLGASGVPLTTSDRTLRDRARQVSACKHVSGQLSVI